MDKVFHIRTFSSPNGGYREVELDLPATDHKLLDAMEQLRLEDGKHPYRILRQVPGDRPVWSDLYETKHLQTCDSPPHWFSGKMSLAMH